MDSLEKFDFDLKQIDPNPWQPRESEDPEHIQNLAVSISKDGLLQSPAGRLVDGRVQLAFGHSRLAAFRFLTDSGTPGFDRMPVIIRVLSDEDMFRLAVSENLQRRDLTPIEEARAMARYRDEFGKSSAEIGGLFGLSDSAVRNKVRLLKLPRNLQDALRQRLLTEGAARALLPLYDLPADVRLLAEEDDGLTPSMIVEVALTGASPKQIGELIGKLMERLPAPPVQLELPVEPGDRPPTAGVSMETVGEAEPPAWVDAGEYDAGAEEDEAGFDDLAAGEVKTVAQPVVEAQVAPPPVFETTSAPLAPAPIQAGPAAGIKVPSWAEVQITVTLSFWPEDGAPGGRMVVVGARVDQELPKMQMVRQAELGDLPVALVRMIEAMKIEFEGAK